MIPSSRDEETLPRVVVGVDGSPGSIRALAWAAREARLHGAVLEIVHADFYRHEVLDLFAPDLLRAERSVADEAAGLARELEPGIAVSVRISDPPADLALIEASEAAEMLVVGTHGLTGLRELTSGSVSRECVRHARCPVVVIGPSVDRSAPVDEGKAAATGSAAEPVTNAPSR